MRIGMRIGRVVTLGVLAALVGSVPVHALDPGDSFTRDEQRCQDAVSRALGQFLRRKATCVAKCDKAQFGDAFSLADCLPPFGGATAACIARAETKARDRMTRKCIDPIARGQDSCPECYAGADCATFRDSQVAQAAAAFDSVLPLVFCSGSFPLAPQARCRQRVLRALGTLAAATAKCLAKCRAAEFQGKTDGSCDSGSVTDAKTRACIDRAAAKAAKKIANRACSLYPIPCLLAFLPNIQASVEAAVDQLDDATQCEPAVCGNGVLDPSEECDPPADGACPGACLPPALVAGDPECICGVDPTPPEVHQGAHRPVLGGVSAINSVAAVCTAAAGFGTRGTLGALVFAVGDPGRPLVLSNSHVFARQSDRDLATVDVGCLDEPETGAGEPIMQPGSLDGGSPGPDDIGATVPFVLGLAPPSLDPYEPICFVGSAFNGDECPGAPGFPINLCNHTPACTSDVLLRGNCIDAAIAKLTAPAAIPPAGTASILDIGPNAMLKPPVGPRSCRLEDRDPTIVGRLVKKSGATTGLTWGRIVGVIDVVVSYSSGICSVASGNGGEPCLVDADCPVPAPGACVIPATGYNPQSLAASAFFVNQLVIRPVQGSGDFSRPGDSGSVVFTAANEPVGLLFAGDGSTTLANPIRPVLDRFGVTF